VKTHNHSLLFSTNDGRFGLQVNHSTVKNVLDLCRRSNHEETGGILLGAYNADLSVAIVTQATEPPNDSKAGNSWFQRGVSGLKSLLERLWKTKREYYLGEWHFHPFSDPEPSMTDVNELRRIAKTRTYSCPEPVMLIIGGNPRENWSARAFVFPNGEKLEMQQKLPCEQIAETQNN